MQIWEIENNLERYLKPRGLFTVPYSLVPGGNIRVTFTQSAPQALKDFIFSGSDVRWYKHPFNEKDSVPYFSEPQAGTVEMEPTASRSMGFTTGHFSYTIKMGTSHPHGPYGPHDYENTKTNTLEDMIDGLHRMNYINRVEAEIGPEPDLILAKEIAFIEDKATGQGLLIRDYSFMKEGHYYLPAFALPFVGRRIAEHNGWNPDAFWKTNYAKVLGRLKARFLLRYGLQMETPNPQNILIELDGHLKPTGRLVFRDLSDTELVTSIAEGLGEAETLARDREAGVRNATVVRPKWENSSFHFNEAPQPYSQMTLLDWEYAHSEAFKKELETILGVDLGSLRLIDHTEKLMKLLRLPQLHERLRNYRQSLRDTHQAQLQSRSNSDSN
jgi:hypothetical protein